MTQMKKVWFTMTLAVAAAVISTPVFAQQKAEPTDKEVVKEVRNELSVWGLGGMSSLMYKPIAESGGSTSLGFGGGGGIGVGRFFNPSFGLRFGLEALTYSGEFKSPKFETVYIETDNGDPFEFRSAFHNYKEKQSALLLNVPIMACYERGMFYAQLGLKLGLSLSATYKATADSIVTTGFESFTGALYRNIPAQGFTTYANASHSGDIKMGLNLALAGEAGAKWKLSKSLSLYTGIYADYGLLNVASKKNEKMVDYLQRDATAQEHTYHSVLNSKLSDSQGEKSFADRVGMLSVGAKVALGINTTTLFAAAKKETADNAYSDETLSYLEPQGDIESSEEKAKHRAELKEQEKSAKEEKKQAKAQEKAERQAAKERGKLTPRQQQMEDDIAELKRVQEILMQQAENSNRNQEAILGAVKAAQDAAAAAADAARAAQTAVMNMQNRDKAAERKTQTPPRKDVRNLSFRIQISARRTPLDNVKEPFAKFGLDMDITEERYTDDTKTFIYKYVVGSYKTVEDAVEACNEVRDKGIKDAFVVAYHKGKRITMAEAYHLLNKN